MFVGVLCLLAIGFPLFVRGRALNPLEPIVLCMFAVAIGCTFRAVYIGFSDYYRSDFLTFGQTYAQIASGGIWVAAALACLSLGYLLTTAKVRPRADPARHAQRQPRRPLLVRRLVGSSCRPRHATSSSSCSTSA